MFAIVGMLVVLAAVIGGFLMERGPIRVLIQPAELLIIGGAAIGTLLVANPLHTLKQILGGVTGVLRGSKFNKQRYLDSLKMLFELFTKARKQGLVAVEKDIEGPKESQFFAQFPTFQKDLATVDFVCDTMRMVIMGGVEAFDVDQMIEADMDVHHHERQMPIAALSTMADSLPGLGIVAAVLGVVLTMTALGGPPEEIGKKVAAALVGPVSRRPAVLRLCRPAGSKHGEARRRRTPVLACAAGRHDRLHEGSGPAAGSRDGPARHSGACASQLSRLRERLQKPAGGGRRDRTRSSCSAGGSVRAGSSLINGLAVSVKPQVIVIKRKSGHGGHHGGAWKVAYADFVTAMMALFIVLWLMNSSKQIQEAVGGYFKDPTGTSKMVGTDQSGSGENVPLRKQDMAKLKEQLETRIRQVSDFDKLRSHIEISVTPEGLRIELLESETGHLLRKRQPETY